MAAFHTQRVVLGTSIAIAFTLSPMSVAPTAWDLQLHEMSTKGQWDKMPAFITDDMLEEFCVSGTYGELAPRLKERYRAYASRISLVMPTQRRYQDRVGALIEELHKQQ